MERLLIIFFSGFGMGFLANKYVFQRWNKIINGMLKTKKDYPTNKSDIESRIKDVRPQSFDDFNKVDMRVKIVQIDVYHGDVIDAIEIHYARNTEKASIQHGGCGGNNCTKIENFSDIVRIEGIYDEWFKGEVVKCLTFVDSEDNEFTCGKNEKNQLPSFSFQAPKNYRLAALLGHESNFIHSIGCYWVEKNSSLDRFLFNKMKLPLKDFKKWDTSNCEAR